MRHLQDVLAATGTEFTSATLVEPRAISRDGTVIVAMEPIRWAGPRRGTLRSQVSFNHLQHFFSVLAFAYSHWFAEEYVANQREFRQVDVMRIIVGVLTNKTFDQKISLYVSG